MRWLLSATAIQCHLAFGIVGALFVGLWFGDKAEFEKALPGNDWIWLLLLLVVVYPFVLFLIWYQHRDAMNMAVQEVLETLTEPQKVKARRVRWRRGSLVAIAVAGAAAVYGGDHGLLVNNLPVEFLGYALLGFAACGAFGVNIWYGGPIDPRFDPVIENEN
ncbi:MAG: hypothetical protein WD065_08090 [Planctomycetaceae bacterium]